MSIINQAINIQTTSINAITPTTGALSIGADQTDGILNLGTGTGRTATGVINIGNSTGVAPIYIESGSLNNTNATPAIKIGTANLERVIKIGNSNTSSPISNVHIDNLRIRDNRLDNVIFSSGAIYMGSAQTNGVINIGTGDGVTRTGAINIATSPNNSCAINIMNGNTTAGSVNIANGTGVSQSTAVNISSGSTTGLLTLGNTSNATTIASGGDINIGLNQTTGILNLGTNAGRIGAIHIGTISTPATNINGAELNMNALNTNMNGPVNLARNTSGTKPTFIEMSSTSNINYIDFHSSGLVEVNYDSRIFATQGNTADANGALTIQSNILTLDNNTVDIKGTTNIATAASSTATINMLNGATTAGSVNIANGTGASQTTAVNIGSGSTTGTVTLGNTANTVQINGAVRLAKPLILGTVATLNTQLGRTIIFTALSNPASNQTWTGSLQIKTQTFTIPYGVWAVSATAGFQCTVAGTITTQSQFIQNLTAGAPVFLIANQRHDFSFSCPVVDIRGIINTSGIINATSQGFGNNATIGISMELGYSSGTYNTRGDNNYNVTFVRVG